MNAPPRILLIHQDAGQRDLALSALRRVVPEDEVLGIGTGLDYAERVSEGSFKIAIAPALLSWGDGAAVLNNVRKFSPQCLTILIGEALENGPRVHRVCSAWQSLEDTLSHHLDNRSSLNTSDPEGGETVPERPDVLSDQSAALSYLAIELIDMESRAGALVRDNALGPHPLGLVSGFLRSAERIQAVLGYLGGRERRLRINVPEPVHLGNAVVEAMRGLQEQIRSTNASILAGPLPVLLVHRADLVTLFHHLLDNAMKFSRDVPPKATIRAHEDGDSWIISVSDNGRGMAQSGDVDPFAMFVRLPESAGLPGTGIGLAVCHQIVTLYQGRIWYESELGLGTTIYVRLRLDKAAPRNVDLTVSFNSQPVGRITVSTDATKMDITKAALALPAISARLGEETIKDVQLRGTSEIDIVS